LRTRDHRVCFDGVSAIRHRNRSNLLERREMKRKRRPENDAATAFSQALSIAVIPEASRRRIDRMVAA
jgi:hypothetical protein